MICDRCKTTGQPVKQCAICGADFCRHDARRQDTGEIVCLDPWECIKRVGKQCAAAAT